MKQNYVNILLMLLRLRQACDHPLLVKGFDSNSLLRSSVEMAKKLPQERQMYLLNCLEASLAICGICNVCGCLVFHILSQICFVELLILLNICLVLIWIIYLFFCRIPLKMLLCQSVVMFSVISAFANVLLLMITNARLGIAKFDSVCLQCSLKLH